MSCSFTRAMLRTFSGTAALLALAGCNTESSLSEAAANGEVEAQYDLAIYYSELESPQQAKAFDWMKRAAGSRFRPAMKKLAEYYLAGYGTEVNYQQAAEWFRRYLETTRSSEEALFNARKILLGADNRQDTIAGFTLFKMAIMHENQDGRPDSDIARAAAGEMMTHTGKLFNWLLAARNYTDAGKLLEYVEKCHKEYPQAFADNSGKLLQDMRSNFIKHLEN